MKINRRIFHYQTFVFCPAHIGDRKKSSMTSWHPTYPFKMLEERKDKHLKYNTWLYGI